jgi:hypothetical protein
MPKEITNLHLRHPGLTEAISTTYREAAEVCFSRHGIPPADIRIDRHTPRDADLAWNIPDEQVKSAWANEIDATEAGAYGIALAAIEVTDDLVAFRRAETKSGADYYVDLKNTTPHDMETAIRLEVSGISDGTEALINARLNQKIAQAKRGNSCLPAIAVVVAFSPPVVKMADAN